MCLDQTDTFAIIYMINPLNPQDFPHSYNYLLFYKFYSNC